MFSIPYYIGAILQIVMAVGVYSNILISALTIFSTVVGVLEIILIVVMLYKFARAYGANIFLAVLSVLLAPMGYTILAFSKLYEYEYCVKESKNEDK